MLIYSPFSVLQKTILRLEHIVYYTQIMNRHASVSLSVKWVKKISLMVVVKMD